MKVNISYGYRLFTISTIIPQPHWRVEVYFAQGKKWYTSAWHTKLSIDKLFKYAHMAQRQQLVFL